MADEAENSSGEFDIAALAYQYLDRGLGEIQRKALNDHLRRDSDARTQFVRCLLQGVELEEMLPEEQASESLRVLAAANLDSVEQGVLSEHSNAGVFQATGKRRTAWSRSSDRRVGGAKRPFFGLTRLFDRTFVTEKGGFNAPLYLATLVAAMAIGAGLAIWGMGGMGRYSPASSEPIANAEGRAPRSGQPPFSPMILVDVTNCRWDKTRSTADLAGGGLKPGQSLHLLEGVAEVKSTLPSGSVGSFQLEGPLAMTLSDDGTPNLMFGKLSGEFSCRRDSFCLGTALGRIVISGDSSLGIRAAANEVELHMFSGTATLDLWSTSLTDMSDQLLKAEPGVSLRVRMTADGSISVDHGKASESRFVTPASLAASQLLISEQYVNAIREAKPVAYWRFEEELDRVVRNEMSDRFQLRIEGNAVRLRSSQHTHSAEFGIAAGPGYMMSDDVFDGVINEDYTVELWAKPTCFHHGALFSLIDWTPAITPKGQHRVYLEFCGPRRWDHEISGGIWESDPGRLFFINRRSEVYSSAPYVVRKWQHLVALRERSSMKLYADGRLIATDENSEPLGSGMRVLMGQLFPPSRFMRDDVTARLYSGELDEVALYDRALSEAEIHKHIELVGTDAQPESPL